MRKAAFIDRDGVINVCPGEGKFVLSWEGFTLIPDIPAQLSRLRAAGFFLVLVTNQSGVGRGLMTLEALYDIHRRMQAQLGPAAFDAIYFCPHAPDSGCGCRKPSPAMIQQACAEYGIDPRQSVMIGDSFRDIAMGQAAGCKTILCRARLPDPAALPPQHRPTRMAPTFTEAVDAVLGA